MKITINNFGPIDTITFDMTKGFHLIYGKNSIGKSYSTYCLYCLIKNIKGKSLPPSYYYFERSKQFEIYTNQLKSVFKKLKNDPSQASEIISVANSYVHSQIQRQIIPGLKTSLLNTFSSLNILKNAYTKKNFSIEFDLDNGLPLVILSDDEGEPFLSNIELNNNWEFIEKTTKSTKYSLYIDSKKSIGEPTEDKFIESYLQSLSFYTNDLFQKLESNIKDVYYLPASRSGLYQALSSFTPILAELTQNRFFLNSKKIELPSLSEPLSDYFIDISTIDHKTINKQYSSIIEDFEKNILEGSVRYDNDTKKIKYTPFDINIELDIAEVSSMIAELSPIVIFLKHILHHKYNSIAEENSDLYFFQDYRKSRNINHKDVIFIEEPEAHLHPEVQVKLTQIFADLTKLKINIVMTSHSNYMFNKINNIILKKELKSSDISVYQLVKGKKGSKCNPNMTIDEEGISDENFVEISKNLYEERLDSLDF